MEKLKYIISADLEPLVGDTPAAENDFDGLDAFRESLVEDLEAQGKQIEYIPYEIIAAGMATMAVSTGLGKVSIDRTYVGPDVVTNYLDITRSADSSFTTSSYSARKGKPPVEQQLDMIGAQFEGQEIVLLDDVLFSGGIIEYIADELDRRNVKVKALLAGIAIGEGAQLLNNIGIETQALFTFEEVEDEVCERDFTAVEGAGKTLTDIPARALYWVPQPYSNHVKMASLPVEHMDVFYENNMKRNLRLFGPEVLEMQLIDVYGSEEILKKMRELKEEIYG